MLETILSVSDLLGLLNQTLEYAYPSVIVEGEVASFKVSRDKYVFFDLKDATGLVGCFMTVYQLRTAIEDGMKIRVVAVPRLTAWGKFSLTIRDIRPVGEGSIKRSSELLKQKLAQEGLFDEGRKRLLPLMPVRIGLIASSESAGYADFMKILGERWGGVEVQVANVQVQGEGAAGQIIRALDHFNESAEPVEVLVLVRGGGSIEDLAVFSDELLVRAVAASRIPTLVGVGHEVDTSLCDLAADVRAATPSNAAQILVPDRHALLREISGKQRLLATHVTRRLELATAHITTIADRLLGRMEQTLHAQQQRLESRYYALHQLDPKAVLQRGYALVRDAKGGMLQATTAQPGQEITIELARAIITAGVQNVRSR